MSHAPNDRSDFVLYGGELLEAAVESCLRVHDNARDAGHSGGLSMALIAADLARDGITCGAGELRKALLRMTDDGCVIRHVGERFDRWRIAHDPGPPATENDEHTEDEKQDVPE